MVNTVLDTNDLLSHLVYFHTLSTTGCPMLSFLDVITREEFQTANTLGMDSYFHKLHRLHPKHRDRYSEQTWIRFGNWSDRIISRILRRYVLMNVTAVKINNMPMASLDINSLRRPLSRCRELIFTSVNAKYYL